MRKRIQAGWSILILLMISLTVTACVRPHPDSQVQANEPTIIPLVTQPAFITQVPLATPDPGLETPEPVDLPQPSPVAIEPTTEPATETTYIVVAGDTLFKIAIEYNVSVEDIAEANGIINIDNLEIGQELVIPAPGTSGDSGSEEIEQETNEETDSDTVTDTAESDTPSPTPVSAAGGVHVVQPGENLFRIGLRYGCSVEQLSRHNGIANPNRISVGMEIEIPDCD